jgi:hypothetical protein
MVYHTLPGKVPALESIFRDVSKLQTQHDLNVVGYWVPDGDTAWANTFIYLVAHTSQAEAKKNWDALHADPAFSPYRKQAAPLIERAGEAYKVDEVYNASDGFLGTKVGAPIALVRGESGSIEFVASALTPHSRRIAERVWAILHGVATI